MSEAYITSVFINLCKADLMDDMLPWASSDDRIVLEMPLRYGRADIVMFHQDGTATVIEVKDGSTGYTQVVAGIGQAGLYATQLMMAKGALKGVRRALLWSSTGDAYLDTVITLVCAQAEVKPLLFSTVKSLLNCEKEVVAKYLASNIEGQNS
jgi:hypothetical protein